jgi:hypothetical protein
MILENPELSAMPAARHGLFKSFFMAGFECSTHKTSPDRRLDMIAATQHDKFALLDYDRITTLGMCVAREGLRWHLIEQQPGNYDFSSVRPILEAAESTGAQVIWDLCHFGWPDHIDVFHPDFPLRLAGFAAAFARLLKNETNLEPFFVPVNEISFFSWAGGEEGSLNPFARGRGFELKCQLVRASMAVMDGVRAIIPEARFVHVDPIIHVVAHPDRPEEQPLAEAYRRAQFQSWDMLAGRVAPELGGHERYLDILGLNYYIHNQWVYDIQDGQRSHEFEPIDRSDPLYRPLREILQDVHERYGRPLFIAETGAEDQVRAPWLKYVGHEVEAAVQSGVPIEGICLYPILNHPGWADDRHCHNGLWDYADARGNRELHQSLAAELRSLQKIFESNGRQRSRKENSSGHVHFGSGV